MLLFCLFAFWIFLRYVVIHSETLYKSCAVAPRFRRLTPYMWSSFNDAAGSGTILQFFMFIIINFYNGGILGCHAIRILLICVKLDSFSEPVFVVGAGLFLWQLGDIFPRLSFEYFVLNPKWSSQDHEASIFLPV